MRTVFPIILVLALGLTAAFFVGSGFNDLVTGDSNTGALQDEVNNSAANSSVGGESEDLSTGRSASDDGSIVGFIVSGGQRIFGFAGMVLALPITLENLGFPRWFAWPIGAVLEIIVSIGLVQFITGRDWS